MNLLGWIGVSIMIGLIFLSEARTHHRQKTRHAKMTRAMFKVAILFILAWARPAHAAPSDLGAFIKASIEAAEGGSAFNLAGQRLGDIYVPLRTLDLPWPNILDAGGGAVFGAGHPDGLVAIRINLPQIANGIFGTSWFVNHSHGPALPTLFMGPGFKAAWPITTWRWDHDAFLLLGIPFSSIGL